jgi:hypothetical protein
MNMNTFAWIQIYDFIWVIVRIIQYRSKLISFNLYCLDLFPPVCKGQASDF